MFDVGYDVRFSLENGVVVSVPVSLRLPVVAMGRARSCLVKAEVMAWDVLEGQKLSNVSLADLCEGFWVDVVFLGEVG